MSLHSAFQEHMLERVADQLPKLAKYPFLQFPNDDYTKLFDFYPDSKVLVFGYGSLLNKTSAARSLKAASIATMKPAVAFGGKRVFNYQIRKTDHWGVNQHAKEKAMLNLTPTLNMNSIVNGVLFEVDKEDLASLIRRETGYDLVPMPVAYWDDVVSQDGNIQIKVAYTFVASHELRDNVLYTSTQYYPVRGYLHAIQQGALEYGTDFADFWNKTTFLADGTTSVAEWDQNTFEGILCTKQAIENV